MRELDRISRSLFAAARDIREGGTTTAAAEASSGTNAFFILDPDRLANVARFLTIMWLAFLAVIYINDIPGGTGVVSMSGALGIAFANLPQVPISKMYAPVAASTLFGAALYFFIMPQLTGFIGLGLMIFAATFAICYLFAEPQQALGRTFGLALFLVIASISNEQTYSFLSVAVTAQMFAIIFIILAATAHFPFRLTPDRVFLRLLGRYFRSSDYLISATRTGLAPPTSRLARWRRAFHAREVATLPAKLRVWAPHIDNWVLSKSTPEQINRLLNALQSLTFRLQQARKENGTRQAPFLMQALLDDIRTWHQALHAEFRRLAENPILADEHEALRTRLSAKLTTVGIADRSGIERHACRSFQRRRGGKFLSIA